MEKEIKASPKLLRKIKLYCILNNVENWDNVPYHCYNCVWSDCQRHKVKRFNFRSDNKFRNFDIEQANGWHSYAGCYKWKRES